VRVRVAAVLILTVCRSAIVVNAKGDEVIRFVIAIVCAPVQPVNAEGLIDTVEPLIVIVCRALQPATALAARDTAPVAFIVMEVAPVQPENALAPTDTAPVALIIMDVAPLQFTKAFAERETDFALITIGPSQLPKALLETETVPNEESSIIGPLHATTALLAIAISPEHPTKKKLVVGNAFEPTVAVFPVMIISVIELHPANALAAIEISGVYPYPLSPLSAMVVRELQFLNAFVSIETSY